MNTDNTNPKPAEVVISRFGGVCELGRVLSIDKSTVSRWQVSPEQKGTGGRVPQKYWPLLIKEAKKRKIKLSLRDLAGI